MRSLSVALAWLEEVKGQGRMADRRTGAWPDMLPRACMRTPVLTPPPSNPMQSKVDERVSQRGALTAEQKKRRVVLKRVNNDRTEVR